MNGLYIRAIEASDLPGFLDLFAANECMRVLGKTLDKQELVGIGNSYVDRTIVAEISSWEVCKKVYEAEGSRLWMMEFENRLVGSIGCLRRAKDEMELVRMYVDNACRRRGFGKLLVEHLFSHAVSEDISKIRLTTPSVNEGAIDFYRNMGFTKEKSFMVEENGIPFEISQLMKDFQPQTMLV